MTYRFRVVVYVLLALVGYVLPWVISEGSALSMGAYDLSEWTSLHPLNREAAIPLITSGLLRLPLALVGIYLVTTAAQVRLFSGGWWVLAVSLGIFVLASMPPLEWLTEAPRDPNYLQQAVITAGLVIAGLIALSTILNRRLVSLIQVLVLGIALIAAWTGFYQAIALFQQLELVMAIGSGLILFSMAVAVAMLDAYVHTKRVNQTGLPSND